MRAPYAIPLLALCVVCLGCPSSSENGTNPAGEVATSAAPADTPSDLLAGLDLTANATRPSNDRAIGQPVLVDVHEELGIDFAVDNGASPAMLMVQSTCGGASWLDYDADGWLDLYLPQGGNPFEERADRRPSDDRLFRSVAGDRFEDVSVTSIPSDDVYGHGAYAGDFDNDGFDDIYVTNVGPDLLYHNLGDGTFENVTESAGIDNSLWGTSAAWYDLDQDGDLDIYVCNYLDYDPLNPIACLNYKEEPGICHPRELNAVPNRCYFNQGDGTFLEEAEARGLNAPNGKSLGVVVADLNGDDRPDVFVANDVSANHLFVNQGDGTFDEQGQLMGCALSGLGQYQASMGVGFGDFDENGFPDLYVTHFTGDSNTLYANYGPTGFEDETRKRDLHQPTLPYLAFGTVMSDLDFDGRQDLFVANGHIDDWREDGDLWFMPAQLLAFDGDRWHDCSAGGGAYFERNTLSRGVASADYDHDGDMDLAVVHQNEPMGLLRNDSKRGHWLQLQFIGHESNRRGVGVQVTVEQGERLLVQQLAGGTSFCVGHQPALFFGLGDVAEACNVSVEWPSGISQQLKDIKVDQILVISEQHSEAR